MLLKPLPLAGEFKCTAHTGFALDTYGWLGLYIERDPYDSVRGA
jgi:hypothetical protein